MYILFPVMRSDGRSYSHCFALCIMQDAKPASVDLLEDFFGEYIFGFPVRGQLPVIEQQESLA